MKLQETKVLYLNPKDLLSEYYDLAISDIKSNHFGMSKDIIKAELIIYNNEKGASKIITQRYKCYGRR